MKIGRRAFGLSVGLITGLSVSAGTIGNIYWNFKHDFFFWLATFLPGYAFTVKGSLIGFLWGFAFGFISAFLFAWLYNTFCRWLYG